VVKNVGCCGNDEDACSACDDNDDDDDGGLQQPLVGSPGTTGGDVPHAEVDQPYQTSRGRNVSKYSTICFIYTVL